MREHPWQDTCSRAEGRAAMAPGAHKQVRQVAQPWAKMFQRQLLFLGLASNEKSVCAFWHFSAKRASKFCRKNWKKSLSQNDFGFFFLIVYKTMHVFKKKHNCWGRAACIKKVKPNRIFKKKIYMLYEEILVTLK